ncbi:hypothetical protein H0H81_010466 [Sphagnurus paluster]|uniref:Uncharacterized protein n=1 Tax=Sphagnurus paluster TaxID=117069 RepID=A0A9P7GPH0_9AGAR|nr:hypothetical protein H0H81_010466 [Sphagnurus paluster]
MPKQFITVYLGVVLEQASTGVKDKKSAIISDIVLAITFIITVLAMWYIFRQMNKVKPEVIYERRKARQAKIARAAYPPYNTGFSASSVDFERGSADSDSIPLKVQAPSIAQSWDTHSEYRSSSSTDLPFYAPRPQHPRLPLPKHPEDLDVVYANAHDEESHGFVSARGYSTDEVGWDMNARPKMIARAEDMYGVPFESTDTVQQQQTKQQPTGRPSPSPSPAVVSSTQPVDAPTPTQAQFASWKPPVDDDDDLPTPLPMPRFREPPREAMAEAHYGHGQEPTDASYTTAREPSSDDQEHPRRTSPRVHSPPPPSYPTSVR